MELVYAALVRLPTEKAHGIQIMKTAQALAGSGIFLELVIPKRNNPIVQDPFSFYNLKPNFSIIELPGPDFITKSRWGFLSYWLQGRSFAKQLRAKLRVKPQTIIYTRDLPLAYALSTLPQPLFYEIHSLPKTITFVHRAAWKRARGIVVISNGLKQALIVNGIEENKILVAHDAVDVEQFRNVPSQAVCREKFGIPLNQKTVMYTGHLYDWKGAETLAKAGKILGTDSIHTYLVGGTEQDIEKFKIKFASDTVHIVGHRPHAEIPYWLAAADVLVIPNSAEYPIGAVYTSPLKVFEYLAAGRPIVASDVPALREILENKAEFVDPDNIEALIAGIKKAVKQPMTLLTSQAALAEYDWKKRAKDIRAFISSVC